MSASGNDSASPDPLLIDVILRFRCSMLLIANLHVEKSACKTFVGRQIGSMT